MTAAVSLAGLAPFTRDFDWYAGMRSDGALRAAAAGRKARTRHGETDEFDPESFTAADWATLSGTWSSLGKDVGRANETGDDGLVDDDVALAAPWGFDPAAIDAPVLLVHGGQDRVVPSSHSDWLAHAIRRAELWHRPDDGHISVLDTVPAAMDWLTAQHAR